MATTQTTQTRPTPPSQHYESLIMAEPSFEKETMDQFMEKYDQQIQRHGGKVQRITEWGKRRLSYEIKKHLEGFYFLVEFEGHGDLVKKCDNYLNLQSTILRHLTVKKPNTRKATPPPPAP